ncbi:Phosphoserine phosphatase [Rubrivivax sp. A210]|uniref:HAD family hydrolase n=1 Tax=Rubrivivax sp. A210 TaxID=2772301 RepID=UPI001917E779|nr:HAD family hydrolase [Rubrivivax sp. A210]CAD5373459.1 Phosphoserine phosphatase [Rubrivivax sp. A210]
MKLTVFDLDHTLLAGDSDVLWCDFLLQQGLLDRAEFAARNAAMERDYRAGQVSVQAFSAFYVGTMAGRSAAEWQPLLQRFLDEEIAPRLPAAAHALLRRHQQADDLVVLSTATNRVIAAPTAAHLGITHLIATDCGVDDDGRFNGQVLGTPNMREGKVARLHAWLAARGQQLADFESRFYSDSINDLPLLEAVDHPVVVDADARLAALAAQRGWPAISLRGGA